MIRTATLLACLAFAAPAAAQVTGALSQPVPTLKAAVTVTSDLVRIGDVADNAGPAADIPIFRSPDFGTTGTVPVSQVLEAMREHDVLLVDARNLTEVAVTRAGIRIGVKEIEKRIVATFAGRQNLGEAKTLSVAIDQYARPILIDPAASSDLRVARAYYDPRTGRFDIVFEATGNRGNRIASYRYTGTLTEMAEVAVLTRQIARGDIVRRSDVAIGRRPKSLVPSDAISDLDQAIGSAARQTLRLGNMLRSNDLTKPELVHRDDPVTLVYEVPGLMLTVRGKAVESGAQGDLVTVINVQSKRQVQGYVSGPGRVTIPSQMLSMSPTTVAAGESPTEPPSE